MDRFTLSDDNGAELSTHLTLDDAFAELERLKAAVVSGAWTPAVTQPPSPATNSPTETTRSAH
jgi:hypothetical protein